MAFIKYSTVELEEVKTKEVPAWLKKAQVSSKKLPLEDEVEDDQKNPSVKKSEAK
jgi:hypothetical protein